MFHYKKVSVVTVAHNCERFLSTMFKSFAYQDYLNTEWIIVNDASDDQTAQRLQTLHKFDDRIKLCLNTVHKGYTDSYDFAISKATGDYIAFLEPENFWVKDKISRQVAFMLRYNAVLSHSSYAFADNECQLLPTGCCHIETEVNLTNFRKTTDICLSTFMMNRDEVKNLFPIIKREGTDEDQDILMYLIRKGLVSQGMNDVLTLCRLQYDYPTRYRQLAQIQTLADSMRRENIKMPGIMRYQAYKASNVVDILLDPSTCIPRDVAISLAELKNFKI